MRFSERKAARLAAQEAEGEASEEKPVDEAAE
jgi:hypothetical protein